jgi:uncharacterized protein YodC (DUF2158 family)
MSNLLQVGSVVQLKSGGPVMTISYVSQSKPGTYTCYWFLNGEIRAYEFKGPTLKIITE